jgi:hypothetical protein
MPQGICIADVSVIHPLSMNFLFAAATSAEMSAARQDNKMWTAYRYEPNGYALVPFSDEVYEHMGQLAMKVLHELGD